MLKYFFNLLASLCLIFCITVAFKPFSKKLKDVNFKISYTVTDETIVPEHLVDTLKKAEMLLNKVFSSQEFKDSLYAHSYNDSSYSKTRKPCFIKEYDSKTGRVKGETVYNNLISDSDIKLTLNIKHFDGKTSTMGLSSACMYKITSYDYWIKENQPLAFRFARHIAHEYTHIKGYRHDTKIDKAYKWGKKLNEDPAYGVGSIVGNILTNWNRKGEIKL